MPHTPSFIAGDLLDAVAGYICHYLDKSRCTMFLLQSPPSFRSSGCQIPRSQCQIQVVKSSKDFELAVFKVCTPIQRQLYSQRIAGSAKVSKGLDTACLPGRGCSKDRSSTYCKWQRGNRGSHNHRRAEKSRGRSDSSLG